MRRHRSLLPLLISLTLASGPARAQVVRDGDYGDGKNEVVAPGMDHLGVEATYLIEPELGQRVGGNLYHGFREFNLGAGEIATFNGLDPAIQSIIARVSGGPSTIDGTLRSTLPNAGLVFVNPAGVMFNANATLDLPASFRVSTATQMAFEDGTRFDTRLPAAGQILSAAPVSTFGFLDPQAGITIEGAKLLIPRGLLEVAGGDVSITNSRLISGPDPDGFELPSELPPELKSQTAIVVSARRDLKLDFAELITSGPVGVAAHDVDGVFTQTKPSVADAIGGGVSRFLLSVTGKATFSRDFGVNAEELYVQADELFLNDPFFRSERRIVLASRLLEVTSTFKLLEFTSSDELELKADQIRLFGAQLVAPRTTLRGRQVLLDGGARILLDGTVGMQAQVFADEELVIRGSGNDLSSGIFARSLLIPHPLRIDVTTSRLLVEDGGLIASGVLGTFASGDPDNEGGAPRVPGGAIKISADRVLVRSGGRIDSSSLSETMGGTIEIDARESIEVTDAGSAIASIAGLDGAGGTITLRAPQVTLRNRATITAESTPDASFAELPFREFALSGEDDAERSIAELVKQYPDLPLGSGNAGQITIEASTIALETGARISSATGGSGNGGLIRLDASDDISITGGSSITADSTGTGLAGRIEVSAGDRLRLEDALIATTSSLSSGGDIRLAGRVVDINRSTLSTNVGAGSGGNIEVVGEALVVRDSSIVARAEEGTGGNIALRAEALLVTPDSEIDASSELGIDGNVAIRSPVVDLNATLASLGTGYVDPASLLVERCQLRDREGIGSFRLGGRESLPVLPENAPAARYSGVPAEPSPADRGDFDGFLKSAKPDPELPAAELVRKAEVLEALGELSRARDMLGLALERADGPVHGSVLALQARLWARSRVWGNAERGFSAAERLAEEQGDDALLARVLLDRANAAAEQGDAERAAALHARSQASARRAGDGDTRARSLAASPASGEAELDAALAELEALPASHDRLLTLLHVGIRLAARPGDAARIRAGQVFARAAERADELGDDTATAYAWGSLGELYTREGRTEEATELTRRALAAASQDDRPESIYRFADRLGDALASAGDEAGAARAYTLAVQALERLRGGAVLGARAQAELASAFPAQPLTRKLVDRLLQQARQSAPEQRSALLQQVRSHLESASRRDIRDFFQDECLALEQATELDGLVDALVVHPVFLEDRVELLVSSAEGIEQVRVPAPVADVREAIDALRVLLADRSGYDYREPASRLYDWLIDPLAPFLAQGAADRTLVFVASGALAGIPLAALYDREHGQFLVEQHPIAVSPGVTLIAPRALGSAPHRALQAGLTEAVGDFPALAATAPEIASIRELVGGKTLLDSSFVEGALDHELASTPYDIVHIASHGHFGGDADEGYLLTFDGRLGMSELADLVSHTRFRDQPLELLTLSACETAQGDERAALGLAGVAVRAGARSTLASLWSVNDPGTAQLMQAFYAALLRDGASRARALQIAQKQMLASSSFRHPAYWSPFVLVGSWR